LPRSSIAILNAAPVSDIRARARARAAQRDEIFRGGIVELRVPRDGTKMEQTRVVGRQLAVVEYADASASIFVDQALDDEGNGRGKRAI
jgi:hypothetical protein